MMVEKQEKLRQHSRKKHGAMKQLTKQWMEQWMKHFLPVGLIAGALFACAPVNDIRGYVFSDTVVTQLKKNQTSLDEILALMGSPSTQSTINGKTLYYIYSRFVTESYRAPEEVDRRVLAIYFNIENIISDTAIYGLDDGIIVPIVERTTETQGRELSFIEQIFGNLGRFGDETGGPSDF